MRFHLIPFLIFASLSFAPTAFATWKWFNKCSAVLAPELVPFEDFVDANRVPVTGEDSYSTAIVLNNLGLDEATIDAMKGRKVLSVGEGFSGLTPHLRERGVLARGLDIWYGSKKFPDNYTGYRMQKYLREYKKFLITGDAGAIPAKDHSCDFVVSHMLVNNVAPEDRLRFLKEAYRITKAGGQVRAYGFTRFQADQISTELRELYADQIAIHLDEKSFEYTLDGYTHKRADFC